MEQISYTPAAMISFYFLMSLLEGHRFEEAIDEVKSKFWPTYKVKLLYFVQIQNSLIYIGYFKAAMCVWPAVSTLNFALIPEKNRVVFISVCSLLWTCFLAYMKQLDKKEINTIPILPFENEQK